MGRRLGTILLAATGALLAIGAVQTGVIRLGLPDLGRALPEDLVLQEQSVEQQETATVTRVEPIALDCRARVHATVQVTGTRDHRLAGVTYRTDTVGITAQGDVDTCVDAGRVVITPQDDGTFLVTIPGAAVEFVRPRVDLTAATRIDYDKGLIGEVTDLLPGVADGDDLVMGALGHAQQVVGGDACMREAFAITSQALEQAYADQLVAQGIDPGMIVVDIGEPDFAQNVTTSELGGVRYELAGAPRCTMSADAHHGATPSWQDITG